MAAWLLGAACATVGLGGVAGAWRVLARRANGGVARTDHTFHFVARGPLAAAFPLFGAWGERAWAGPSWQPRFLHPDPARDEEGAVFTLARGRWSEATWVNTAFDAAAGRIQYVYVVPGVQAALIDLRLAEGPGAATTLVEVRYRRTALARRWNEHVRRMGAQDASAAEAWARDVNGALGAGAGPGLAG
jgi:hypothetical protein